MSNINSNSIPNARISFGRLKPKHKQNSSQVNRGIALHNRIGKFFVDIFGSGTIKAKVEGKSYYLNKESCYKLLRDPKNPDIKYTDAEIINALQNIFKAQVDVAKKDQYSLEVMDDPNISDQSKDLFKLLFMDVLNPENIDDVQPLGSQLKCIEKKLVNFNTTHGTHLSFRDSAHAFNKSDPWQTIKITDPSANNEGEISETLKELNDVLFEKFGIQSNGGDDWKKGITAGKKKYTPQCFVKEGKTFEPQLLISLIDVKRILGVIPDKETYIKTLGDAYQPHYNNNPFLIK